MRPLRNILAMMAAAVASGHASSYAGQPITTANEELRLNPLWYLPEFDNGRSVAAPHPRYAKRSGKLVKGNRTTRARLAASIAFTR